MNLLILFISAVISLLMPIGVYRYAPLSLIESSQAPSFGTSITTIQGSDTLSSSRTTINNNFTALNSGKFELTDWYATTSAPQLITLGTITTGVWHGTAVGAQYGGTGSTTPSANQILLGNGIGNVGIVSGWGNSGQLLTSNGVALAPTWQSATFDTTQSYNLTGSSLLIKNLSASSTLANPLTLNGISYNTPNAHGASSTALEEDGSGNLTWEGVAHLLAVVTSPANVTNGSTTVFSLSVPANTLGASGVIHARMYVSGSTMTSAIGGVELDAGYGYSSTTIRYPTPATNIKGAGTVDIILSGNGTTNSQKLTEYFTIVATSTPASNGVATTTGRISTQTLSVDSTQAQNFSVVVNLNSPDYFTTDQVEVTVER